MQQTTQNVIATVGLHTWITACWQARWHLSADFLGGFITRCSAARLVRLFLLYLYGFVYLVVTQGEIIFFISLRCAIIRLTSEKNTLTCRYCRFIKDRRLADVNLITSGLHGHVSSSCHIVLSSQQVLDAVCARARASQSQSHFTLHDNKLHTT